jgi:hypothetical protein
MSDFQVLVSKENVGPLFVWVSPTSTYAAFRRARELSLKGDLVEVWRDDMCVHREIVGYLQVPHWATPTMYARKQF